MNFLGFLFMIGLVLVELSFGHHVSAAFLGGMTVAALIENFGK